MKLLKPIFFFIVFFASFGIKAQTFPPKPNKLVTDGLDVLTPAQEEALEQKLVAFDKKTSTQIVIYTTNDIQGMDAGDYATMLGNNWGVGGVKEFNNGVVFLLYKSKDGNTRKVFIATGKGLEGVLPDYTCSEIVDYVVRPKLRGGDFYYAFNAGTDEIIKATEGKYAAPDKYQRQGKAPSLFSIILIIFLIILFLSIANKRGGGGNGTYMSRRGYRGYTGPTIWWTGGGGGSGWSGGGSSGGGFGGFGGGSFGGGGAGGDW
jgi:uncharacterized protein